MNYYLLISFLTLSGVLLHILFKYVSTNMSAFFSLIPMHKSDGKDQENFAC